MVVHAHSTLSKWGNFYANSWGSENKSMSISLYLLLLFCLYIWVRIINICLACLEHLVVFIDFFSDFFVLRLRRNQKPNSNKYRTNVDNIATAAQRFTKKFRIISKSRFVFGSSWSNCDWAAHVQLELVHTTNKLPTTSIIWINIYITKVCACVFPSNQLIIHLSRKWRVISFNKCKRIAIFQHVQLNDFFFFFFLSRFKCNRLDSTNVRHFKCEWIPNILSQSMRKIQVDPMQLVVNIEWIGSRECLSHSNEWALYCNKNSNYFHFVMEKCTNNDERKTFKVFIRRLFDRR